MKISDWLSVYDIGGLGEPLIPAVRFYTYYLDINRGFSPVLIPEFFINDCPKTLSRYYLSAQEILIKLYNLSVDILPFIDDELLLAKKISLWCSKNIHPYNINKIYNLIPNLDDFDNEVSDSFISKRSWYENKVNKIIDMATINLLDFLRDICILHELTKTYFGISSIQGGDFKVFKEISKIVLHFESQK